MSDVGSPLFSVTQALHLTALAPALLCVGYLMLVGRLRQIVWVPALYFLTVACASLYPIMGALLAPVPDWLALLLLGLQGFAPAFSFLLIMQCLLGRMPPLFYWLILALPLLGEGPFTYAAVYYEEICLPDLRCLASGDIQSLYILLASAVVFLLAMVELSRHGGKVQGSKAERRHKYWLVLSLVLLNLVLLSLTLYRLAMPEMREQAELSIAVARVGFVYLVLTSIFRVFTGEFGQSSRMAPEDKARQEALAHQLEQLMREEKIYREPGLSRAACAEMLKISDAALSRLISNHFRQGFNEWLNGYRTEEAKARLQAEDTSITTIAFEVGYNSIPTFNRVFKQATGMSPTEYREQAQQA